MKRPVEVIAGPSKKESGSGTNVVMLQEEMHIVMIARLAFPSLVLRTKHVHSISILSHTVSYSYMP